MATGYTYGVKEGRVTEFTQFAWSCARAFGALITMRDDPNDAPIPEALKPDTRYYDEQLPRCRADLARLEAMTSEEISAACRADYVAALTQLEDRRFNRAEERRRYESMLASVRAWTPPSADHVGLKTFMVQQLEESISYDCDDSYDTPPPIVSSEEWWARKLTTAKESIDYHLKHIAEEIARTDERNRWIRQLRDSLSEKHEPVTR